MTRRPHRPRPLVPAIAAEPTNRRPCPAPHAARLGAARLAGIAAGTLLAAAGLSGCSGASPATIVEPYQAADGLSTSADILGTQLRLQNFLVVGTAKGKPGTVVGAIGYDGTDEITVTIGTANDKGTPVTVKPGSLALIGGPDGTDVRIDALEAPPGAHVTLRVTAKGAPLEVLAPVVPATGYYASLSPKPAESGSPEPSSTPASPEASPTP